MVNKLEGHIFISHWDLERKHLTDALDVLAELKPNEKIRVVNKIQGKIAPDTCHSHSHLIAGFRSYSDDGWMPTLSVISQIFEKSLSYAYLLCEIVGESELSQHHKESLEAMARFRSLLPRALEKFQRLGDFYGRIEKDEKAKNSFAEKERVYALAIPMILEKIHCASNPISAPHCPAMQELTAMRIRSRLIEGDGSEYKDSFTYKEEIAERAIEGASTLDPKALLPSIWFKISMNVGLQQKDQSSLNGLVDEREWTVIHSSLMGLPVEETVRSSRSPRPLSFTPSLPSIDEENEDDFR